MMCIFTDLDGCLLDEEYEWEQAKKAVSAIKKSRNKLCIVTSKTFDEVVPLWKEIKINSPFAYENGGGVAATEGTLKDFDERKEGLDILYLGKEYSEIRETFEEVKIEIDGLKGFGDMTVEEISGATGLSKEDAKRAKNRRHEEVFLPNEKAAKIFDEKGGYRVMRGTRFYHLMGGVDKGTAVGYITQLLKPDISVSIGDSENDYPMFEKTDKGILLGGKESSIEGYDIDWKKINIKEEKGPSIWNEVILDFLERL